MNSSRSSHWRAAVRISAFRFAMHRETLVVVAFMVLIVSLIANCKAYADNTSAVAFNVRRAIAIETFLNVPSLYSKSSPTFPYYDLGAASYGSRAPEELKRVGFDAVRLAIEPVPLMNLSESERQRVYPIFKAAIDSFLVAGLNVVLDIHVTERDPKWNPVTLTAMFGGERFQSYLSLIASIALLVADYDPRQVALELFNEPPCISEWRWSSFQKKLFSAARKALPQHTLILSSACYSAVDALQGLDPAQYDDNTIFSFHFYEPSLFTYQGLPWVTGGYKYIRRLPYPPVEDRSTEFIAAMEAEIYRAPDLDDVGKLVLIGQNTRDIRRYFRTPRNRTWLKQQIDKANKWASQMDVPPRRIFVGEFGVNRDFEGNLTTAIEDRLRWLKDTRTLIEEAGFSWSVWSDCCEFGIIRGPHAGPLDPDTLKALGLDPP